MSLLDFERIGRVEAYLLRHRILYTDGTESHRVGGVEKDVSRQMLQLTADEYDALSQMLAGKGFSLRVEDQTFPGIPRGAKAWLAVRRPDYDGPNVLTLKRAWKAVALNQAEPKAETVYWFTFMWFLTMSFFYDRSGRAVSEVSRYVEANFRRDELEQKITSHIEDMRRAGLAHDDGNPVASLLLGGGGDGDGGRGTTAVQIRKRVGNFLKVMVDTSMLDMVKDADGEQTYQQSLVCAVQIDELFAQDLIGFMPDHRLDAERTVADDIGAFVHADIPEDDDSGDGMEDDHGSD